MIRVKLKIAATLFAMCGGEANERLFSHQGLGHSIFTFFVLDYIKEPDCWEKFNIQKAMDDIYNMCFTLSSLMLMHDKQMGHPIGTFNPNLLKTPQKLFVHILFVKIHLLSAV